MSRVHGPNTQRLDPRDYGGTQLMSVVVEMDNIRLEGPDRVLEEIGGFARPQQVQGGARLLMGAKIVIVRNVQSKKFYPWQSWASVGAAPQNRNPMPAGSLHP